MAKNNVPQEGLTSGDKKQLPAFSNKRVFVIGTNDPCTHQMHQHDYLGVTQHCDGPRYIIVGPGVSDEKLQRNIADLSSSYGVTLAQLQGVRDSQPELSEAQAA